MFLQKGYEVPQVSSSYMKLQKGSNQFRILSSAITGWQYWNVDKKPVRQKEKPKSIPADIKVEDDGTPSDFKHFWAFVVWDYADNSVKILEITQATIQRDMKIKIDNRKGDAKGYDFIITRTGDGLLTEYDCDVTEASPCPPEAESAYTSRPINLEALYDGLDPFVKSESAVIAEDIKF